MILTLSTFMRRKKENEIYLLHFQHAEAANALVKVASIADNNVEQFFTLSVKLAQTSMSPPRRTRGGCNVIFKEK